MVYIPYPRTDLDNNQELIKWRAKSPKIKGDWKSLKEYLANSARINPNDNPITKCWYSELPQGDNYALDVEHFRPKNSAVPLTQKQIKQIEKLAGVSFEQENTSGSYSWLEFDYRNYRIVTALTNRGGAKHIYFPVVKGTKRLQNIQLPWKTAEYPFLLDPTNPFDAKLLFVKPDGTMSPLSPKIGLTAQEFSNLSNSWHSDGFNYIRAYATIVLYRLNDTVFIQGRKEVYNRVKDEMINLTLLLEENPNSQVLTRIVTNITKMILPSAPFSLAAKSALLAFEPTNTNSTIATQTRNIAQKILAKVEQEVKSINTDWDKP